MPWPALTDPNHPMNRMMAGVSNPNPYRAVGGTTIGGGANTGLLADQQEGLGTMRTQGAGITGGDALNAGMSAAADARARAGLGPLPGTGGSFSSNGIPPHINDFMNHAVGQMGGGGGGGFNSNTTMDGLAARQFQSSQRIGYRGQLPASNGLDDYNAANGIGQGAGIADTDWAGKSFEERESGDTSPRLNVTGRLPGFAYGSTPGVRQAIVGDPQADGGPNPEIVTSASPIHVMPLKGEPPPLYPAASRSLPKLAYGNVEPAPLVSSGGDMEPEPLVSPGSNVDWGPEDQQATDLASKQSDYADYAHLMNLEAAQHAALWNGSPRPVTSPPSSAAPSPEPPPLTPPSRVDPFAMTGKEKAIAQSLPLAGPSQVTRDNADVELMRKQVQDNYGQPLPSSTPNMDALPPWVTGQPTAPYDAAMEADAALARNAPASGPAPAAASSGPPGGYPHETAAAGPPPASAPVSSGPPNGHPHETTAARSGGSPPSGAQSSGPNALPFMMNGTVHNTNLPMTTPRAGGGTEPPPLTGAAPPAAPAAPDPQIQILKNRQNQLEAQNRLLQQKLGAGPTYESPLDIYRIAANNGSLNTPGVSEQSKKDFRNLDVGSQSDLIRHMRTPQGRLWLQGAHTQEQYALNHQEVERQKHLDEVGHQRDELAETTRWHDNQATRQARVGDEYARFHTLITASRDAAEGLKHWEALTKFENGQRGAEDANRQLTARFEDAKAKGDVQQQRDINSVLEAATPAAKTAGQAWLDKKYPAEPKVVQLGSGRTAISAPAGTYHETPKSPEDKDRNAQIKEHEAAIQKFRSEFPANWTGVNDPPIINGKPDTTNTTVLGPVRQGWMDDYTSHQNALKALRTAPPEAPPPGAPPATPQTAGAPAVAPPASTNAVASALAKLKK